MPEVFGFFSAHVHGIIFRTTNRESLASEREFGFCYLMACIFIFLIKWRPRGCVTSLAAQWGANVMSSKSWMRQSMLAAVAFAFATSITIFSPRPVAAGLPTCASLAGGLTGKQGIKSANSVIVAAAGGNVSYCQVNILYGTNPNQNINIFVTLPLSAADGGSGGVQGAWERVGPKLSAAEDARVPALRRWCRLQTRDTYLPELISDMWAAIVNRVSTPTAPTMINSSKTSSAMRSSNRSCCRRPSPEPTTHEASLRLLGKSRAARREDARAICWHRNSAKNSMEVAHAPAIYWSRFQTAQMWGQIAMKQFTGAAIDPAETCPGPEIGNPGLRRG